nr:hypothetical protein [Tanacetum cinerariifolium]
MHADLKYVKSLKKEIDELESENAEFSDMYDVILQDCVSKDVTCYYWKLLSDLDTLAELQCKGTSVDTKFNRPSVARQPNAQWIPKPSVLGKLTPFSDSPERRYFPKTRSVPKTNVSEGLSKPVTAQTLPKTTNKAVSNTNVLKPGMYRIDNRTAHTRSPQLHQTVRNINIRMSTSTGVTHKPNVSRPQLKSNQSRDKVLPNNSQVKVKKTQVEVHPRISSVSNKMKSVTACKKSLNSRNLNANDVCATCNKCLVDSNHFACVTKILNDVHARTKNPTVVPISTIKPKSQANKSIVTPNKKKVASKSTNQKPQSYFRVLKSTCFIRDLQGKDLLVEEGIEHQTSTARAPEQNGVVERWNRTLVEPARTMLSASQLPLFFWAEAIATASESIHIRFDEIKEVFEMSVANNTSGLVPQRQKASDYDNPDPVTQRQDVSSSADEHSTSAPSTHTNVHAEENNNDQAEGEQLQDDEFTNPLCALTQDVAESSSHNIGTSNVPTFNQLHVSEYRWMKDHPLEQVCGNPSRPVQTRRRLATDPEMCMYALTVSTAEPKNIKEAMADSAWIEAMQEELHQFDRLR